MKHFLQYCLLKPLLILVIMLPRRVALFLAKCVGALFFVFYTRRRQIALSNLDIAFGDKITQKRKKQIARRCFQNLAMSLTDLLTVRKVVPIAETKFEIRGLEHYEKALSYGRGVILELSHMGSWEYMAFLFTLTKTQCNVIVKDIRNPYLDKEINNARRLTGLNPVPKKNSVREILRGLKRNETAAVLIDQWAGPEGIWDYFFSKKTSITTLPYRLALKTRCALLPGFCLRKDDEPDKYIIELHPPLIIDPDNAQFNEHLVTKQLNQILEEKITEYPEQWTWGHRRWKPKPKNIREADVSD